MNTIQLLYGTLHLATLAATTFAGILSFKNPFYSNIYLATSTILHIFLIYNELRTPSKINQTLANRIFMNYSVHFIAMNLLFYIVGSPLSWALTTGITSLYRVIEFLSYAPIITNQNLSNKIKSLYNKLTNPPLAQSLLATFEIMTLMMPALYRRSMIWVFIRSFVYLFGFILYRYATDCFHQQIWGMLYQKIYSLLQKLPQAIGNFFIGILNSFSRMGLVARQIYRVRVEPVNNNQ